MRDLLSPPAALASPNVTLRLKLPKQSVIACSKVLPSVCELKARRRRLSLRSAAQSAAYVKSLILNLPGSPRGAVESLEAVIDMLPHALQLLSGNTEHS